MNPRTKATPYPMLTHHVAIITRLHRKSGGRGGGEGVGKGVANTPAGLLQVEPYLDKLRQPKLVSWFPGLRTGKLTQTTPTPSHPPSLPPAPSLSFGATDKRMIYYTP